MKHLPKHLQPRRRYLGIGIEALPDASFGRAAFQRTVWYAAQDLYGDAGSAAVDLTVLSFDLDDGVGEAVVRTHRGRADRARAAIACVDAVEGHPVGACVRGISGTVRGCEERYLNGRTRKPEQRDVVFENELFPAVAREKRVDVDVGDGFVGTTRLDFE